MSKQSVQTDARLGGDPAPAGLVRIYTEQRNLLVALPQEKLKGLTKLFSEQKEPIWPVGDVTTGKGVQVLV